MPSIASTKNSELTAVITSDPEKASKLLEKYKLLKAYSYEKFGEALAENLFDAVYIATPNWLHKQFAVQALEAGCHVLLEKPMEVTEEDCHAINAAQRKSGAKLMIAYRLHVEPGTVEIINRIRSGDIGDPRIFSSVFSQPIKENNYRAKSGFEGGPVFDLGIYQIQAARSVFGMEPEEVSAVGFKSPNRAEMDFHDTVSVTMRFPGERVGSFTVSYNAVPCNKYSVIGTKGEIEVCPAFTIGVPISYRYNIGGKEHSKSFKLIDQFAAETEYFSDCVINGSDPEPNGDEGWRDVRIITAIKRSLETGRAVKLEPQSLESRRHPIPQMVHEISLKKRPGEDEFVNCDTPSE